MNKLLRSIALIIFAIPALLLSAEDDDHTPVGTRLQLVAADEEVHILPVEEEEEQSSCGFIFDRYPPVYYPSSFHFLRSVSALGDSLELEDGSVWKLPSASGMSALYWRADTPVAITQNASWFSGKYKYCLIYNPQSDYSVSIDAALHLGPYINGEHTLYISDIDFYGSRVALSDCSQWEIYSWDHSKFRSWLQDDVIIIGFNSAGWFDAKYEALLINVTTNDYVRARQY